MRLRGTSIRRKIVALLLVPLVSLTALWIFATALTGVEAARLLAAADVLRDLGEPADDMIRALQQERRQTLVHLADRRDSTAQAALRERRDATDRTVTAFRTAAQSLRGDMGDDAGRRLTGIDKRLDDITDIRRKVDDNTVTSATAFTAYNEIVDPQYAFFGGLSTLQNVDMDRQGRSLVGIARAREALSREDALLAAALAAGTMSRTDLRAFSDRVAERRILYSSTLLALPTTDQETYEDYWQGSAAEALRTTEDAVILAGGPRAHGQLDPQRWQSTVTTVLDDLARMDHEAVDRYADRVEPVALGVLTKAACAGVLGLAALLCSLVVSLRVGRGLVRDLRALRKQAHEASGVRLPAVMRRLAAGETVDIEAEAPPADHGPDELGQVARALGTLQRAAVEAAVKQAELRRGVSAVFVNLARRNQVLLHRQLRLLDAMERRTEDPAELADLFRLDHLTTRMRRHAEGLVILSGAAPGRQWRGSVPLMDVVRAAVAEVEAYERVEVRRLPPLAVHGPAVADLTHLLAELLENATVFSPPHTAVQVHGERVPNGFALEIHDRGLGMTPDALLEANLRLAETPEFELTDTDRLGLFVVSRLARRHGVRVSLQPSPYGGTTAVALVPSALLTEAAPRHRPPDAPRQPPPRLCPFDEQHHQASEAPAPLPRRRPPTAAAGPGEQEHTPSGGLPRRVRQAALAAQPGPTPTGPSPERDADEVRARMAALQRGWQRGRESDDSGAHHRAAPPDGPPSTPPTGTAPGTTPEGDGP
ncbi:nitrate- and nitrite sensing domain-containing protein [Streptomyces gamaensis]|uniref:histidine kinase n=1 Tax=Streptomyces gamaensis TaxID=1763542 RepID=A0ABW0Z841_9ACTN